MSNNLQIVWLIPFLPLIGFLINGLLRKQLSKSMVGVIGSGVILASFLISVYVFFLIKNSYLDNDSNKAIVPLFKFINTETLKVGFSFQIDRVNTRALSLPELNHFLQAGGPRDASCV